MRIWRVQVKNEEETRIYTRWGTATSYEMAAMYALESVKAENPKEEGLWIDEVSCFGEKSF